jgi:hypothetical protein
MRHIRLRTHEKKHIHEYKHAGQAEARLRAPALHRGPHLQDERCVVAIDAGPAPQAKERLSGEV